MDRCWVPKWLPKASNIESKSPLRRSFSSLPAGSCFRTRFWSMFDPPEHKQNSVFHLYFSRFLRNPASRLGTSKSIPKYLQNGPPKWPRGPPKDHKSASKAMCDFSIILKAFWTDFGLPNGSPQRSQNQSKIRLGRSKAPQGRQRPPRSLQGAIWRPPGNHFGAFGIPFFDYFGDMLEHSPSLLDII